MNLLQVVKKNPTGNYSQPVVKVSNQFETLQIVKTNNKNAYDRCPLSNHTQL